MVKKKLKSGVRWPRQPRLPGTEDPAIEALENAAVEHSDILTEIRMKRAELKGVDARIVTLMQTHGKKSYNHGGVILKLRKSAESVSVKVKRHEGKDAE